MIPNINKEKGKPFYTERLSILMYGLLVAIDAKSYLEIGVGWGYTALFGISAVKSNDTKNYKAWGYDIKNHRLNYAKKLLAEYSLNAELTWKDFMQENWKHAVDVVFIDAGHKHNQAIIDKLNNFVTSAFIVHDVDKKLNFPYGFNPVYIDRFNCAIAVKNHINLL